MSAYQKYVEAVEFSGIRIPAPLLLIFSIIFAALLFVFGFLIDPVLGFLLALLVIDVGIGLPFLLAGRKVDLIERRLPDVLHHISTTLRTGGTVETALREVTRIDYGPITDGFKTMLREMNEGKTFEDSFMDYARRSRSKLMERSAIIIIAARKSGGGLLDTLSAMAEDIRAVYRLKRERKSKTFMQFMFIIVAGCFVAPFVFGIVKSVLQILLSMGGTFAVPGLLASFDLMFKAFLVLEAALSTLGAVQVREGRISRAVMYIPFTVLVTYVIYVFIASSFLRFLGG